MFHAVAFVQKQNVLSNQHTHTQIKYLFFILPKCVPNNSGDNSSQYMLLSRQMSKIKNIYYIFVLY